jgi:hypothetical protein
MNCAFAGSPASALTLGSTARSSQELKLSCRFDCTLPGDSAAVLSVLCTCRKFTGAEICVLGLRAAN